MTPKELKQIRTSLGLTQAQLAKRVGLDKKYSFQTVSRWERGKEGVPEYAIIIIKRLQDECLPNKLKRAQQVCRDIQVQIDERNNDE